MSFTVSSIPVICMVYLDIKVLQDEHFLFFKEPISSMFYLFFRYYDHFYGLFEI